MVPIHKKGSTTEKENYRPISLISPYSKVFEKAIMYRLLSFFEHHDILSKQQYGFRKNKTTIQAIIEAVETIAENLDKQQPTIGAFLDLSKAFDCVDIELLLRKLENYGIRGNANNLLRTYLIGRRQFVVVSGITGNEIKSFASEGKEPKFGVPQGSVAGPLLYLIYVNSILASHCPSQQIFMYADDTTCLFSEPKISDTEITACVKLNELQQKFTQHNLLVNDQKTNIIIFKQINSTLPFDPQILLGENQLDKSEST